MNSNQEYHSVDQFLRNATFEVEDRGFSDRVIGLLPKHAEWERRLQRIWQMICLAAALLVGWLTNVFDILVTDLKVMLETLPLNYNTTEMLTFALIPSLALCLAALAWGRKVIY